MNRYEKINELINKLSPIPENIPKVYFLGDTGTGKTTIIRKILETDEYNFPTTRQRRTTVATTEYVISRNLPYKATIILKTENEIRGYINEILQEGTFKLLNDTTKYENAYKYFRQTSDQRFRLYYILSENELNEIVDKIKIIIPAIKKRFDELQKEFPDRNDEKDIFDWVFAESKTSIQNIEDVIFENINIKVAELCDSTEIEVNYKHYQFSSGKSDFVEKCKKLLSSEKDSISPVIEYARIQGNLLARWFPAETEIVLIDGEGIGHDAREASQLAPRHYDYFYNTDAIVLVEESQKPFVASGKSALKNIFERGYGDKLILAFSKLDEVIPYDIEKPTRADKIDEVKQGLENVIAALRGEKVEINLKNDDVVFLSDVDKNSLDSSTKMGIERIIKKSEDLSKFKYTFIEPEYDYEMLSAYLKESTNNFIQLYQNLLSSQHWQTIKAFNRRMSMEIDSFRMFTPITDFEEKITNEVKSFLSNPIGWSKIITEKLKLESINQIKREFNKQILNFARELIIRLHNIDWNSALEYSGSGSTFQRKNKIEEILDDAVPSNISSSKASAFKDKIKEIIKKSVKNCEEKV